MKISYKIIFAILVFGLIACHTKPQQMVEGQLPSWSYEYEAGELLPEVAQEPQTTMELSEECAGLEHQSVTINGIEGDTIRCTVGQPCWRVLAPALQGSGEYLFEKGDGWPAELRLISTGEIAGVVPDIFEGQANVIYKDIICGFTKEFELNVSVEPLIPGGIVVAPPEEEIGGMSTEGIPFQPEQEESSEGDVRLPADVLPPSGQGLIPEDRIDIQKPDSHVIPQRMTVPGQ